MKNHYSSRKALLQIQSCLSKEKRDELLINEYVHLYYDFSTRSMKE